MLLVLPELIFKYPIFLCTTHFRFQASSTCQWPGCWERKYLTCLCFEERGEPCLQYIFGDLGAGKAYCQIFTIELSLKVRMPSSHRGIKNHHNELKDWHVDCWHFVLSRTWLQRRTSFRAVGPGKLIWRSLGTCRLVPCCYEGETGTELEKACALLLWRRDRNRIGEVTCLSNDGLSLQAAWETILWGKSKARICFFKPLMLHGVCQAEGLKTEPRLLSFGISTNKILWQARQAPQPDHPLLGGEYVPALGLFPLLPFYGKPWGSGGRKIVLWDSTLGEQCHLRSTTGPSGDLA